VLEAAHNYARCGQQTYYLGRRMQELLGQTDLAKVPEQFVRAPYPTFWIALEDSPCRIWGGPRTQWHQVAGVYVVERRPGVLGLVFWGKENERSVVVGDDATFWIDLTLADAPSAKTPCEGMGRVANVAAYLDSMLGNNRLDASDPGMGKLSDVATEIHHANLRTVVRTVFNLLLYLNSADPEQTIHADPSKRAALKKRLKNTKSKAKRRKLQRKLDNTPAARVVWIGKSLEREPKRVMKTGAGGTRTVRQHWRKGHWRPYWTGPRKDAAGTPRKGDKQVLRWVQPTLVGRDMADMVRARGTVRRFTEDKDTP
jgi:hypothetical protein